MFDLTKLNDADLILSAKAAVQAETTSTINVVRHFCEVYERQLHLKHGFGSMFLFATKELGYDKAPAQRRVAAMELALRVPVVLEKIDRKELSLQKAADIQTFLNFERGQKRAYSQMQIEELVEVCSGLSCTKVQIELAKRNAKIDFRESIKFISEDRLRISHTISIKLEEKLERIKELRAHVNPYATREEILDYMADFVLDRIDPVRRDKRIEERKLKKTEVPAAEPTGMLPVKDEIVSEAGEIQLSVDFEMISRTRYISAQTRREVRRKNNDKGCCFIDPQTGKRCGSRHQLQLDHVVEFSRGGRNEAKNLQVVCAQHNRYRWRAGWSRSFVRAERLAYG